MSDTNVQSDEPIRPDVYEQRYQRSVETVVEVARVIEDRVSDPTQRRLLCMIHAAQLHAHAREFGSPTPAAADVLRTAAAFDEWVTTGIAPEEKTISE